MKIPSDQAFQLLTRWFSAHEIVSLSFEDRPRFALSVNARIAESPSASIKFALRPEMQCEPLSEYLFVSFDEVEDWDSPDWDSPDPLIVKGKFKSGVWVSVTVLRRFPGVVESSILDN